MQHRGQERRQVAPAALEVRSNAENKLSHLDNKVYFTFLIFVTNQKIAPNFSSGLFFSSQVLFRDAPILY